MVFERLRKIICEQLELKEEQVTIESNLVDDFDADSLDLVDIVMSIEDEFGIEVPEDNIEDIRNVADVVKFIEENMK
ncbi:MAG: acyl carrier protein [Oscillospiraceae bacterium]